MYKGAPGQVNIGPLRLRDGYGFRAASLAGQSHPALRAQESHPVCLVLYPIVVFVELINFIYIEL